MSAFAAFCRDFWSLAKPYFLDPKERLSAWGLLTAIIGLNLATVAINVWFNFWNNHFYNALQEKNYDDFQTYLLQFSGMAALFIVVAVYQLYLNQMLQIRWRRWLTEHWMGKWLEQKRYYHLQLLGLGTDNPDQRIAEDLRQFPAYSLTLTIGLMNSVVTLFSFLGILWSLSGDFALTLGGTEYSIPGYMVWVALVYAGIGTWLTHLIGRPLTKLNFEQQRYEADFRFTLVRLREYAEGIAFQNGEETERRGLRHRFGAIFDNYYQIMRKQKQLTWFTAGYAQIAIIFPFLVAAPRYFSGRMELGGMMQTASAFGQVQSALSYIITSYTEIAEWRAVIDRLTGFRQGMLLADEKRAASGITTDTEADHVRIDHLALDLPDGRPLMTVQVLDLQPGDSLLVQGRTGSGKTSLLRALAGLWPFGHGRIARPPETQTLFLPQRPYLPLGSLRMALAYPDEPSRYSDAEYRTALAALDLQKLTDRLDDSAHWTQLLSGGEQQRVQLARALLKKPAWLFMDEATSALDDATEAKTLAALRQHLPDTAVFSIGHRPALQAFHQRHAMLQPAADGGAAELAAG